MNINYVDNIKKSGKSIYDIDEQLYIPDRNLEKILAAALVGFAMEGLALRTRAKAVKAKICETLGYDTPKSFKKTRPRFPGQNFDVYVQKQLNVQIWNEEISNDRRYVFCAVNDEDKIYSVKVLSGGELSQYRHTKSLTSKYQASIINKSKSYHSKYDTDKIKEFSQWDGRSVITCPPNDAPNRLSVIPIISVYSKLQKLIGKSIKYINATQERNRGAELHKLVCKALGYSQFQDNGQYPDIFNQLLEIKLQTSPTIDLGLHSPDGNETIINLGKIQICCRDIRYAIFSGKVTGDQVTLDSVSVVTGADFSNFFRIFDGNNKKIQINLPKTLFS